MERIIRQDPLPEPAVAMNTERQPVVILREGEPMADSRDVAAYFSKEHKRVLQTIRELHCSDEFRQHNFVPLKISDLTGESTSHVMMTKDGFAFLAMGFTGAKAGIFKEHYIAAFNAMESELRSRPVIDPMQVLNDPVAMRGLLLTYSEKVLALEAKVEAQGEKVAQLDRIEAADGSMCLTLAAKTLKSRPIDLFRFMEARRWIYKRTGSKNWVGYQDKIAAGYLEHSDHIYLDSEGRERVSTQVKVTGKGLVKLAELLNEPLH